MAAEPLRGPLFDALVRNSIKRDDVAQEAQARARDNSRETVLQVITARSADEAVDMVLRAALLAAAPGVRKGARVVAQELATEAAAVKQQDPRTVPALRDADLAAERAKVVIAKAGG